VSLRRDMRKTDGRPLRGPL